MKKITALLLGIIMTFCSGEMVFALTKDEAKKIDLTESANLTAEELELGLKGNLKGLGENFVSAEEEHGVNALFLAGLAALESGWGKHCFKQNNLFGWSGKSFESFDDCIDYVAKKLAENYLDENGKHYHGSDLAGVNKSYCGTDQWLSGVAGTMVKISNGIDKKKAENEQNAAESTGNVTFR